MNGLCVLRIRINGFTFRVGVKEDLSDNKLTRSVSIQAVRNYNVIWVYAIQSFLRIVTTCCSSMTSVRSGAGRIAGR
jgi:hypothetical protein